MVKEKVLHIGTVKRICGNQLIISVLQQSSCNGCQAKDECKISHAHSDERDITVPVTGGTVYSIGDTVCVSMSAGLGMKAVWLFFGYPLLFVLACAVLVKLLGGTDLLSIAVIFVVELLWFVALFIFRNRLENKCKFNIEGRIG